MNTDTAEMSAWKLSSNPNDSNRKKCIQELGIQVLQLSEHRVATGVPSNHEIHWGGRRQMRVQMLPAKQGVQGRHKSLSTANISGIDVF